MDWQQHATRSFLQHNNHDRSNELPTLTVTRAMIPVGCGGAGAGADRQQLAEEQHRSGEGPLAREQCGYTFVHPTERRVGAVSPSPYSSPYSPAATVGGQSHHRDGWQLLSSILAKHRPKRGRKKFSEKLMEILSDPSNSSVISWLHHGRSFYINSPEEFTRDILPLLDCSGASQFNFFVRRLYRWGFKKISMGPDAGSYFNPLFRRDRPDMCLAIRPKTKADTRDGCPEMSRGICAVLGLNDDVGGARRERKKQTVDSRANVDGSDGSLLDGSSRPGGDKNGETVKTSRSDGDRNGDSHHCISIPGTAENRMGYVPHTYHHWEGGTRGIAGARRGAPGVRVCELSRIGFDLGRDDDGDFEETQEDIGGEVFDASVDDVDQDQDAPELDGGSEGGGGGGAAKADDASEAVPPALVEANAGLKDGSATEVVTRKAKPTQQAGANAGSEGVGGGAVVELEAREVAPAHAEADAGLEDDGGSGATEVDASEVAPVPVEADAGSESVGDRGVGDAAEADGSKEFGPNGEGAKGREAEGASELSPLPPPSPLLSPPPTTSPPSPKTSNAKPADANIAEKKAAVGANPAMRPLLPAGAAAAPARHSSLLLLPNPAAVADDEIRGCLQDCMKQSQESQQAIHDWDRAMGLRRCHSTR